MRLPAAPVAALAVVLSLRQQCNILHTGNVRIPGAVGRQTSGQPACVTVQGRHAGPKLGESAYPARQSIQKGHRKRSSAFPRPSGTIRPCSPKAFAPALHRRQGVESARCRDLRPGCAHMLRPADAAVHRRGCVSALVRRRLLASTARLQTRARGPAAATKGTRVRSPIAPAGSGSNSMCKNLRQPHDKTGPRSPTQRAGTPDRPRLERDHYAHQPLRTPTQMQPRRAYNPEPPGNCLDSLRLTSLCPAAATRALP